MSPDGHCGSMMSWRSLPYLFYLVLLARIEPARAGCKDSIEKGSLLQEKMFMPNYYMVQLHTRQNVTEDNAVILERSLKEWCCASRNNSETLHICHMYSDCYKKETPELACETKQKEVAPLNMYVVSLSEFNCMMAHEKNVKKSEYYPESDYLANCRTNNSWTVYHCTTKGPTTDLPISNVPEVTAKGKPVTTTGPSTTDISLATAEPSTQTTSNSSHAQQVEDELNKVRQRVETMNIFMCISVACNAFLLVGVFHLCYLRRQDRRWQTPTELNGISPGTSLIPVVRSKAAAETKTALEAAHLMQHNNTNGYGHRDNPSHSVHGDESAAVPSPC